MQLASHFRKWKYYLIASENTQSSLISVHNQLTIIYLLISNKFWIITAQW
jgi:hypothetical protein